MTSNSSVTRIFIGPTGLATGTYTQRHERGGITEAMELSRIGVYCQYRPDSIRTAGVGTITDSGTGHRKHRVT